MNSKIKKIANTDIQCHPKAQDAWLYSLNEKKQYETKMLSTDLISMMQGLEPLHVVKGDGGGFLFFAGWHWFALTQCSGLKKVSAIIYDKPSENLIRDSGWAYLLSSQFQSTHRRCNLAYMSSLLRKIPKNLTNSIYKNYKVRSFELLSGETPSAVKNQQKLSVSAKDENSIIDQILAGD